jgi:hypothetical protein
VLCTPEGPDWRSCAISRAPCCAAALEVKSPLSLPPVLALLGEREGIARSVKQGAPLSSCPPKPGGGVGARTNTAWGTRQARRVGVGARRWGIVSPYILEVAADQGWGGDRAGVAGSASTTCGGIVSPETLRHALPCARSGKYEVRLPMCTSSCAFHSHMHLIFKLM